MNPKPLLYTVPMKLMFTGHNPGDIAGLPILQADDARITDNLAVWAALTDQQGLLHRDGVLGRGGTPRLVWSSGMTTEMRSMVWVKGLMTMEGPGTDRVKLRGKMEGESESREAITEVGGGDSGGRDGRYD
ncbi:hypothetical protein MLD38_037932 [Melastoma candidum]|uniref:Uncharacterized protein n=1 Tax=Melastoma candidum TaxID=119954 RepID=A0ACB9KXX2_9MYRT|nr:hypothetical protein MLD38_037932 [Melastoma candidum]